MSSGQVLSAEDLACRLLSESQEGLGQNVRMLVLHEGLLA